MKLIWLDSLWNSIKSDLIFTCLFSSSEDIEKLKKIRTVFDETGNLISAVHTFKVLENSSFKNLLPPLELLSEEKKNQMLKKLKELNFINEKNQAA